MSPCNRTLSPLGSLHVVSLHTVSSGSVQMTILITNANMIREVPLTPTLSMPSTPEWGNCFPNTCIIHPQPPQHEAFAIVSTVHSCSLCSPCTLSVNGVCIPHLLDYWSHSHTGASVEKEARPSDKECLIGLWWCLFFFLKVAACCSTNRTCSLEWVLLKRGQSCWGNLLHALPGRAQEKCSV